jgi:hypothetical protein
MSELHNAGTVERKQELIEPHKIKLYLYFATNSHGKPVIGNNIRSIISLKKFRNLKNLNDYGISNVLMEKEQPYINAIVSTEEDFSSEEIITNYEMQDSMTSIISGKGYSEDSLIISPELRKKGIMIFASFKYFEPDLPFNQVNNLFLLDNFKPSYTVPEEKNP